VGRWIIAMTIAISSLLVGAALALRFKVMILLPAIVVAAVLVIARGVFHGDNFWWVILTAILVTICLQLGYLIAAFIRVAITPARPSDFVTETLIPARDHVVSDKQSS